MEGRIILETTPTMKIKEGGLVEVLKKVQEILSSELII